MRRLFRGQLFAVALIAISATAHAQGPGPDPDPETGIPLTITWAEHSATANECDVEAIASYDTLGETRLLKITLYAGNASAGGTYTQEYVFTKNGTGLLHVYHHFADPNDPMVWRVAARYQEFVDGAWQTIGLELPRDSEGPPIP